MPICSRVDTGLLPFGAVVNNAAVLVYGDPFKFLLSLLLGVASGVELLNHVVNLCLIFYETATILKNDANLLHGYFPHILDLMDIPGRGTPSFCHSLLPC